MTVKAERQRFERWLTGLFPGSMVVERIDTSMIDGTTQRRHPVTETLPLFDLPEEAKEAAQLSDFAGNLMLIRPLSTKGVDTSFGPTNVVVADVVVVTQGGKLVSLPQTFIFWKAIIDQLESKLGSGRWVAGILRQGAGKNSKAWSLGAPTAVEQSRLADVMNSGEFRAIVSDNAEEPF